MTTSRLLTGDCRAWLARIKNDSVDCCVTSPPYFGLRDYGMDGQMGLEQSPADYVQNLVEVFRDVRRVLKPDGTLWLNLGDSYARAPTKGGSGPGGKNEDRWGHGEANKQRVKNPNTKQATQRGADIDGARDVSFNGLAQKQLLGIPWRVAFALQADGWYLRQDIIWHKPNPMPESVRDRCTKAHEYLFLLSKNEKYYFDQDAILEPVAASTVARLSQPTLDQQQGSGRVPGKTNGPMKAVGRKAGNKTHKYVTEYEGSGSEEHRTKAGLLKSAAKVWEKRNRRSVWTVTTKPFKEAHFATFPPALIEPCILAGCRENGIVLDPFGGAGTTALVAEQHNRNAVLIELNPAYVAITEKRLLDAKQKAP